MDRHDEAVKQLAKTITVLDAPSLGLQWAFPPSDGSLSAEVFRIEVIGAKPEYPSNRQMVVLYRVGVAGASAPNGTIHAQWEPEPIPVAIATFEFCVTTSQLLPIEGLADRVDIALRKQAQTEIDRAQKIIDNLTPKED
jgi:hypothetical protein